MVSIVNAMGTVVVEYTYDAWGKILSTTGTLASTIGAYNPFRYRGYYYDSETGWYYLQSRYYDPIVGRFLNADNIIGANGDLVGYNMFAYCSNNPVIGYDPSGRDVATEGLKKLPLLLTAFLDGPSPVIDVIVITFVVVSFFITTFPTVEIPDNITISIPTIVEEETDVVIPSDAVSIDAEKDVAVDVPKNKHKNYVYIEAWLEVEPYTNQKVVRFGKQISFQEAQERVRHGESVMCGNYDAAFALAVTFVHFGLVYN